MEQPSYLTVRGLRKGFGNAGVLKGIDLSLGRGEVLAVIGASGSGKTTLLRCLCFLEAPDAGLISVGGETLLDVAAGTTEVGRRERLHFGLVFQSFNLFPQYTVLGNVMLAPLLARAGEWKAARRAGGLRAGAEARRRVRAEVEAEARALLARVGLSEKADETPCRLSGGQQQRVAIARALCLSPDILCFDEPTSALDPGLTGEVLSVIRSLKSGDRTMIVVTHEMEFARGVADRVAFMEDGVIREEGSPEDLFDHPRSPALRAFLSGTARP